MQTDAIERGKWTELSALKLFALGVAKKNRNFSGRIQKIKTRIKTYCSRQGVKINSSSLDLFDFFVFLRDLILVVFDSAV